MWPLQLALRTHRIWRAGQGVWLEWRRRKFVLIAGEEAADAGALRLSRPALRRFQRQRRRDVRQVREALREVAEQLAGRTRVLLREQPELVGAAAGAIEQLARLDHAPLPGQAFGEPERARHERAL